MARGSQSIWMPSASHMLDRSPPRRFCGSWSKTPTQEKGSNISQPVLNCVQSRLQCLDASVVAGLRTLVFCIARLLHLSLPNTSTRPGFANTQVGSVKVALISTVPAIFLEIQGNPWGLGIQPSGSLAQLGSQESSLLISSLGKIPLRFRWQPHPTHQQLVKSKVDKTNQPLSNTNYLNENANNPHNKPKPPKETPWISIRCLLLIWLPHSSMYATCRAFANLL